MNVLICIESGFHQGAHHRFDCESLSIGSGEFADIFLSDNEIPETLLTLQKREDGVYTITYIDEKAVLTDANDRHVSVNEALPEKSELFFGLIKIHLESVSAKQQLEGISEFQNLLAQRPAQTHLNATPISRGKRVAIMASAAAALIMVGFLATSTYVSASNPTPAELAEYKRIDLHNQLGVDHLPDPRPQNLIQVASSKNPSNGVMQSVNEIMQDLSRKLGKVELFEVNSSGESLTIDARLSRKQLQIFERALAQLNGDFGDRIKINANVYLNTEQQIVDEITVRQVVMGNMPFVVLTDGSTLFAGSTYRGLTLSSINFDRLEFKGDQTYIALI